MAAQPVAAEPTAHLRTETVTSAAALADLAGWDDLVREMPRPSPFMLHGWIVEWWRHYGVDRELAVQVAYRGDRLVGVLPLCVRRLYGLRIAELVGGTWAILGDALLAPGEGPETVRALVDRAHGYDFASLFGLPGSSRLVEALPAGSMKVLQRLEAPVLDLSDGWDATYARHLSGKARAELRRRRRLMEKAGTVEISVARRREEVRPAIDEAFRIHALRWRGRHDPTGFATPTGMRFHRAALLALAELDVPRVILVRLDGKPIAFALCLHLEGRAYGVTMAFDPEYARFSPGHDAKMASFAAASAEGITRVELLGADAPHKRRFTDGFDPVYQGIGLAQTRRGRAAAELLADGIRLRRRAKRSPTARAVYARARRLVPG